MFKFKPPGKLNDLWNRLYYSRFGNIIIIAGIVVIGVIFVIAGFNLLMSFLALLILALIIWLDWLWELAGALLFALLIHFIGPNIIALVKIWGNSPPLEQTVNFLLQLGYIKLTALSFFAVFILKFLTQSIKLFNISVSAKSSIENKES